MHPANIDLQISWIRAQRQYVWGAWAGLGSLGRFGELGQVWGAWVRLGSLGTFGELGYVWGAWVRLGSLGERSKSLRAVLSDCRHTVGGVVVQLLWGKFPGSQNIYFLNVTLKDNLGKVSFFIICFSLHLISLPHSHRSPPKPRTAIHWQERHKHISGVGAGDDRWSADPGLQSARTPRRTVGCIPAPLRRRWRSAHPRGSRCDPYPQSFIAAARGRSIPVAAAVVAQPVQLYPWPGNGLAEKVSLTGPLTNGSRGSPSFGSSTHTPLSLSGKIKFEALVTLHNHPFAAVRQSWRTRLPPSFCCPRLV